MGKPERPCIKCGETIPADEDFCPKCTSGYEEDAKGLLNPKTPREQRNEDIVEVVFGSLAVIIMIPVGAYYFLVMGGAVIQQTMGQTAFIFFVLIFGPLFLRFWWKTLKLVFAILFHKKRDYEL